MNALGRLNWLAERDADGIRPLLRPLPEIFALKEAENAPPEAIQVDGDDGDVGPIHDFHDPPLKREQLSQPGQLPLGEDTDQLSTERQFAGGLQRSQDRFGALAAINGDDPIPLHEPAKEPPLGVVRVDDHAGMSGQIPQQQDTVHPGHMVRNQQGPSSLGNVLQAVHANAIHDPRGQIQDPPRSPAGCHEERDHNQQNQQQQNCQRDQPTRPDDGHGRYNDSPDHSVTHQLAIHVHPRQFAARLGCGRG